MLIGAQVGYRGMVREILRHLVDGLGGKGVAVCATGGYAGAVLKGSDLKIKLEPDLTLYGLCLIYELNNR